MTYAINATSKANQDALITIKDTQIKFGTTPQSNNTLASPADLFLSAFAACILKNVQRFSVLMKFEYAYADITVNAIRLEKPHRMDHIDYQLTVYTNDQNLNSTLLKKNIEKFGTIYNTVKLSCTINGTVQSEKIKTV